MRLLYVSASAVFLPARLPACLSGCLLARPPACLPVSFHACVRVCLTGSELSSFELSLVGGWFGPIGEWVNE